MLFLSIPTVIARELLQQEKNSYVISKTAKGKKLNNKYFQSIRRHGEKKEEYRQDK